MAALSPVMSIAAAGMLPNPPGDIGVALNINGNLTQEALDYRTLTVVSTFANVITQANTAQTGTGNASITNATFETLLGLGNSICPGINDIPSTGNTIANLFFAGTEVANTFFVTAALAYDSQSIMGNGDLSRFCQVFQAARGYLSQVNSTIDSLNEAEVLNSTFDPASGGMDSLSTGGANQVSDDLENFGIDLANLGFLIDLSNLNDFGLPGELLAQIGRQSGGTVPVISDFLQAQDIPDEQIDQLSQGNNTLTSSEELRVYNAMLAVSGETLDQVKLILGVNTAGIVNMSQLLDIKRILPNSYLSLLCPTNQGLKKVYLPDGSVNTELIGAIDDPFLIEYTGINTTNSYSEMSRIIPPEWALAAKCLAKSMQQIKSVTTSTLPSVAAAVTAVETSSDLGLLANLTTPIPESVSSFIKSELGQGTGENGRVLLSDLIGLPAGIGYTADYRAINTALGNISGQGGLANIVACYDNMLGVLGNSFGDGPVDIPSGPGQGTYTDYNNAFIGPGAPGTGLIPAATSEFVSIQVSYPDQIATINQSWDNVISNASTQISNQDLALVDYGNLNNNSRSDAMSFASSLHDYGADIAPGGASEILTALANTASLSGQSIVASLREGRNIQNLQDAGIRVDT